MKFLVLMLVAALAGCAHVQPIRVPLSPPGWANSCSSQAGVYRGAGDAPIIETLC